MENLKSLSEHSNEFVRKCVASNPNTPVETLLSMEKTVEQGSHLGRSSLLYSLISNPSLPSEMLSRMYDKHVNQVEILASMAKNPNVPRHILDKLLQDERCSSPLFDFDPKIKDIAKENQQLLNPDNIEGVIDFIVKKIDDEESLSFTFEQIALSPDQMKFVIDELIKKREDKLIENPETPSQIIERIVEIHRNRIKDLSDDTEDEAEELFWRKSAVYSALENPSAPYKLAEKIDECEVVYHPEVTSDKLHELFSNGCCLEDLAMSPNTPEDILRHLFEQGEYSEHLQKNPKTPGDILRKIFEQYRSSSCLENLALNQNTPEDILAEFIKSDRRLEAAYVLENVGVPESLLVNQLETLILNHRDDMQDGDISTILSNPAMSIDCLLLWSSRLKEHFPKSARTYTQHINENIRKQIARM